MKKEGRERKGGEKKKGDEGKKSMLHWESNSRPYS